MHLLNENRRAIVPGMKKAARMTINFRPAFGLDDPELEVEIVVAVLRIARLTNCQRYCCTVIGSPSVDVTNAIADRLVIELNSVLSCAIH